MGHQEQKILSVSTNIPNEIMETMDVPVLILLIIIFNDIIIFSWAGLSFGCGASFTNQQQTIRCQLQVQCSLTGRSAVQFNVLPISALHSVHYISVHYIQLQSSLKFITLSNSMYYLSVHLSALHLTALYLITML